MPTPAPTIVRDVQIWPTADAAKASLPDLYANHPYIGRWLQSGDESPAHVFSTEPPAYFLDQGWTAVD